MSIPFPAKAVPLTAALLRRYDLPGPRYTSYPTAPQFPSGFGRGNCARRRRQATTTPFRGRPRACLPVVVRSPTLYGAQDLHGLVWEWTGDFSALLVDADNRNQGDADNARFCGAGGLSMDDRDNYAVLMRVAML